MPHEPEELMLQVKKGDRAAFAALYERFKGPIYSFLRGIVGREALAEELTHEVFLKVYRSREAYEPKAKFSTWLWTIARHAALDELRKKSEYLAFDDDSLPEPAAAEEERADTILLERSAQAAVDDCVSHLPQRQKEALLLRTHGEHSYEEISQLLEISLANVKNLLHRAKHALVLCLNGRLA